MVTVAHIQVAASSGFAELERVLSGMPEQLGIATRDAVNNTAKWANTRTLRAITSELAIKREDIAGAAHRFGGVTLQKGTIESPVAEINVTGNRIPLYLFGARPTAPPTRRGVTYQITRAGGTMRIAQNAFVAVIKSSDHIGIFRRVNKGVKSVNIGPGGHPVTSGGTPGKSGRFPIAELRGPSIPQVAENSSDLQQALDVDASEQLEKNFFSQIDRFVGKGFA